MSDLRTSALSKRFTRLGRAALDGVSLEITGGRTLAVVGPSGSGKSTLLRIIAGLERADSGEVFLGGRNLRGMAPQARRIAMVFQDAALAGHMTVAENLRFAARERAADGRIEEVAASLHVGDRLGHLPRQLSGGERQRVAIGRSLLSDPLVLLLDEPLAHVDPWLRARIRDDVFRVRERFDGPIVYVTHDHGEAMALGDVLAVLIEGRIEQVGDPQAVYDRPQNLRVAKFLGAPPMNLLTGAGAAFGSERAIVGIRPERVRVGGDGQFRGRVERIERAGADAFAHVETEHGTVVARVDPSPEYRTGDEVGLSFAAGAVRKYDPDNGEIIE